MLRLAALHRRSSHVSGTLRRIISQCRYHLDACSSRRRQPSTKHPCAAAGPKRDLGRRNGGGKKGRGGIRSASPPLAFPMSLMVRPQCRPPRSFLSLGGEMQTVMAGLRTLWSCTSQTTSQQPSTVDSKPIDICLMPSRSPFSSGGRPYKPLLMMLRPSAGSLGLCAYVRKRREGCCGKRNALALLRAPPS